MAGSRIRLYGATSGYVELAAPAVSPDAVITLPPTLAGIGTNVVQTVKTDFFSTSSLGMVDITGLSVTITPSSASSKILVMFDVAASNSTTTSGISLDLLRGATHIYAGTAGTTVNNTANTREIIDDNHVKYFSGKYLDSPATTSATTYKLQGHTSGAGTMYINRRGAGTEIGLVSQIMAIEVAA